MSLRCRTTVRAVMFTVGIVVGACAILGWCGYSILTNAHSASGEIGVAMGVFSPFTLLTIMIDPYNYAPAGFDRATYNEADPISCRWVAFITSLFMLAAYAAAIWAMYRSMVKNFDMTIRKQSR